MVFSLPVEQAILAEYLANPSGAPETDPAMPDIDRMILAYNLHRIRQHVHPRIPAYERQAFPRRATDADPTAPCPQCDAWVVDWAILLGIFPGLEANVKQWLTSPVPCPDHHCCTCGSRGR